MKWERKKYRRMLDWYQKGLRFHSRHLCVREHTQRVLGACGDARARAIEHPYETCAPRGKAASAIRRRSAIRSIEENVADSLRWLQLPHRRVVSFPWATRRRSNEPRTISPEYIALRRVFFSLVPSSLRQLRRGWLRFSTLHSASGCRAYGVMTQERSVRTPANVTR